MKQYVEQLVKYYKGEHKKESDVKKAYKKHHHHMDKKND